MEKALKGSCIIGQSGGPTSVINASAYGVIRTALDNENITRVLGAAHGIKGVLEDKLYDMGEEDAKELELLMNTPSSELGSCRYKMADPDADDTDYKRILEIFRKYNVRYFFYNGGNDSMDTCAKISRFMAKSGWDCRVMGVPKTIDNDLNNTDHCPGFASAAKYIATSCAEIYKDARVYDTGMVCIVEIMGRHAGWLTAAAALAGKVGCGPDLIYLPETDFDMDRFVADVERVYNERGNCLVAVSEGVHYADGSFVSEAKTSATDGFGHAQLGGLASLLAAVVKQRTRRQGPRHRAQPPAALRRPRRLRRRRRGGLQRRPHRRGERRRRRERQDGRLQAQPRAASTSASTSSSRSPASRTSRRRSPPSGSPPTAPASRRISSTTPCPSSRARRAPHRARPAPLRQAQEGAREINRIGTARSPSERAFL